MPAAASSSAASAAFRQLQSRQLRRLAQRRSLEDRQGARQPAGLRREPGDPQQRPAAHAAGALALDRRRGGRGRRDGLVAQHADELAHEERATACDRVADVGEGRVGLHAERPVEQLAHRPESRAGSGRTPHGRRVGEHAREELRPPRPAARAAWARQTATGSSSSRGRQEGEEAQGRGVGPVGVVHAQRGAGAVSERATTSSRPWRTARRVGQRAPSAGAPLSGPSRPAAIPAAPASRPACSSAAAAASGGSSSWRITPNAYDRSELRSAGAKRPCRPRSAAVSAAAPTSRVLPIPGGPSTTARPPRPSHAAASSSSSRRRSSSRSRKAAPGTAGI